MEKKFFLLDLDLRVANNDARTIVEDLSLAKYSACPAISLIAH